MLALGKTSTFNVILGEISPDSGDVFINGSSIIAHPNTARPSLGVCPQFTAIDSQLTVRQHLAIYGLLKGLRRGPGLRHNVNALLQATTLTQYADMLAIKLSGVNQRKLSFAIALIGAHQCHPA
jgi:ATP-binding cassette, subfamily A (ABC1), member 3